MTYQDSIPPSILVVEEHMKTYLYAISRRDIPLAHQSIQSAHAAIEYARIYDMQSSPSYIHLTVRDKAALEKLREKLNSNSHQTSEFHEPYQDWGLTAIACCLSEDERHELRGLPLWRLPTQGETA